MTRLLLVGFATGAVVSSLTGSELAGWLAALAGVAVLTAVQRVRGSAAACALERPRTVPADAAPPVTPPTSTE